MQDRPRPWFKSLFALSPSAPPREWLRSGFGVALAMLVVALADSLLFNHALALALLGPAAASAFLLFAASSSPFARPWPVLVGNLVGAGVGLSVGLAELQPVVAAALAASLTLGGLSLLRCLHPPACAMALVAALGGPALQEVGYALLATIAFNAGLLVVCALLYNNLTGHPYPKGPAPRENDHHTRDPLPSDRISFTHEDVDQALLDFGEYVDVTRDDLEQLIRQTEKHAVRRTMGQISAADIMSRDLYWCSPRTSVRQALRTLQHHHLRALPVLDGDNRLVGIVTLVDLLRLAQDGPARLRLSQLTQLRRQRVEALMSTPVIAAGAETHMVELVSLLSDRGLHCLPIVDAEQRLLGMVTQTDLVAALYRNWIAHLPD